MGQPTVTPWVANPASLCRVEGTAGAEAAQGVGFPPGKLRHGGERSARPPDSRKLQAARLVSTQAVQAACQPSPRSGPRLALPEDRSWAGLLRGPQRRRGTRRHPRARALEEARGTHLQVPQTGRAQACPGAPASARADPAPCRRPRPSASSSASASSQARDVPGRRPSCRDGVRRVHFRVPPPSGPRAPSHRRHRTIGRPPGCRELPAGARPTRVPRALISLRAGQDRSSAPPGKAAEDRAPWTFQRLPPPRLCSGPAGPRPLRSSL